MAEDDIAFLLNRGELVEPHENEQAEVNAIEIIWRQEQSQKTWLGTGTYLYM